MNDTDPFLVALQRSLILFKTNNNDDDDDDDDDDNNNKVVKPINPNWFIAPCVSLLFLWHKVGRSVGTPLSLDGVPVRRRAIPQRSLTLQWTSIPSTGE